MIAVLDLSRSRPSHHSQGKDSQVHGIGWTGKALGSKVKKLARRSRGRTLLRYFRVDTLNQDWFESQWNQARSRAGKRYTPDLDVSLPIYAFFEAIGQDPSFFDGIEKLRSNLQKGTKSFSTRGFPAGVPVEKIKELEELLGHCEADVRALAALRQSAPVQLPLTKTRETFHATGESLDSLISAVGATGEIEKEPEKSRREYLVRNLENTQRSVFSVEEFAGGRLGAASNARNILVIGPAGGGKTHLFCEMTQRRIRDNLPSLLFLGQAFQKPFTNALDVLVKSLAPSADPEEFLRSLDQYARERSVRCVIALDAINEGHRESWTKALPAFVEKLQQYEGIALAISCRTPFEKILFPEREKLGLQMVFHDGYPADEQDAAVEKYFTGYGIPLPEVPLLEEEFSNPLFLKLFCEAIEKVAVKMQHAQLNSIASGQRGMTHILEYFIKQKDRRIAQRLGTPVGLSWKFSKDVLAEQLASNHTDVLPYADVLALADAAQPAGLASSVLLRALIDEDVLAEDVVFLDGKPQEVIRFTYQKFSDHLIARHLLSSQLDASSNAAIKDSLKDPQRLGFFFRDETTALDHANIAQAIMVEFPTRIDNKGELLDFIDWKGIPIRLCEAFVEGLYWREPRSINSSTEKWITAFLGDENLRDQTLNVLLALSVKPKHPFNATTLDKFLNDQSLVQRDLLWTEYLRHSKYSGTPLRILAWAEHVAPRVTTEFAFVYVIVLKWFLTSTQRGFRDRSTHALFRLGRAHPSILFDETARSMGVNDPYVTERLVAASYGTTMALWQDRSRVENKASITKYARNLFDHMFGKDAEYGTTHILTRDFAQHTIELALRLDPALLTAGEAKLITRPFSVGGIREWKEEEDKDAGKYRNGDAPLGMDFANYTLGRLTRNRSAYDFKNADYQRVKAQIFWRIYNLGYTLKVFSAIDQEIARGAWYEEQRGRNNTKTDRYGKKYAWIAFYELAGYRQDVGLLDTGGERIPEIDIDPSFPESPGSTPIFTQSWIEHHGTVREWIFSGLKPPVENRIIIPTIEGIDGPWVVLHGHVNRVSDNKSIFAFLDGLLIKQEDVQKAIKIFSELAYPGNRAIPRPEDEYYTFAGEIPWAETWRPQQYQAFLGARDEVPVGLPVRNYSWESYHSNENPFGGASFLTKEIAEELNLYVQLPFPRMGEIVSSRVGSVFLRSGDTYENSESVLLLRQDLLEKFLATKELALMLFVWGERRANYHTLGDPEDARALEGTFSIEDAVHKQGFVYNSGAFRRFV